MRKKLIAGNWKMNGSPKLARELAHALKNHTAADVALFPSFVFIPKVVSIFKNTLIKVGAQNVSEHTHGAYTGEVSANMLKEVGCQMVLVGHSERRALFAESDDMVAQKFVQVQTAGLTPVLCVGETLAEREAGQTAAVVLRQLEAVLKVAKFEGAVLAYEPVWAIGTGKTATPEQAQEVHALLRHHLAAQDSGLAQTCRILYGGSVNPKNAAQLFAMPDIDGGLVGGASLKLEDFLGVLAGF